MNGSVNLEPLRPLQVMQGTRAIATAGDLRTLKGRRMIAEARSLLTVSLLYVCSNFVREQDRLDSRRFQALAVRRTHVLTCTHNVLKDASSALPSLPFVRSAITIGCASNKLIEHHCLKSFMFNDRVHCTVLSIHFFPSEFFLCHHARAP